jgi:hypothetical protein
MKSNITILCFMMCSSVVNTPEYMCIPTSFSKDGAKGIFARNFDLNCMLKAFQNTSACLHSFASLPIQVQNDATYNNIFNFCY